VDTVAKVPRKVIAKAKKPKVRVKVSPRKTTALEMPKTLVNQKHNSATPKHPKSFTRKVTIYFLSIFPAQCLDSQRSQYPGKLS